MKRIGCIIAALTLLLTLPACRAGGESGPTLRIGVALYQQEDTFIDTVARELQRVALEEEQARNVKINLYITDGKESQTTQNEQVDRFLERGYDVICVNIVDPHGGGCHHRQGAGGGRTGDLLQPRAGGGGSAPLEARLLCGTPRRRRRYVAGRAGAGRMARP